MEILPLVGESILTDRLGDEISYLYGFREWKQIFSSQDLHY